jgi:hypothetical protein
VTTAAGQTKVVVGVKLLLLLLELALATGPRPAAVLVQSLCCT